MSQCHWCGASLSSGATECPRCGAPVQAPIDSGLSGWTEAPRLRDLTTFAFGQSRCTTLGGIVPIAEIDLDGSDTAIVEAGSLLWKDPDLRVRGRRIQGGMRRSAAGMPHLLMELVAPGSFAISGDDAGELVVLPVAAGTVMRVRERAFLATTGDIDYDFEHISGIKTLTAGGHGFYVDVFTAKSDGVLVIHGAGDVIERRLGEGASILVEMGSMLYWDQSVTLAPEMLTVHEGVFRTRAPMIRATGPGRIGLQSMTPRALL